ncbi:MAG: hypothetical protein ACPGUV_05095 [Polyangiales bacterium]
MPGFWWDAEEVKHVLPNAMAVSIFLDWFASHNLGRKRGLDTFLAATYYSAGITTLIATNARDDSLFQALDLRVV